MLRELTLERLHLAHAASETELLALLSSLQQGDEPMPSPFKRPLRRQSVSRVGSYCVSAQYPSTLALLRARGCVWKEKVDSSMGTSQSPSAVTAVQVGGPVRGSAKRI